MYHGLCQWKIPNRLPFKKHIIFLGKENAELIYLDFSKILPLVSYEKLIEQRILEECNSRPSNCAERGTIMLGKGFPFNSSSTGFGTSISSSLSHDPGI